ncbi:MAG: IS66 family insertion sequence element accessory protein TnpB [Methylococcales bacterium]|nr:IS66 family insertion sequence element accessory protein TnpB [Methylococcales bacterium]
MALSKKWIGHIETWQASCLAQAYYCRQQGLNTKTFSAKLCEYRRGRSASAPALIPVQVHVLASEPLVLRHVGGHRLELPPGASAAWLAELWLCLG